MILVTAQAPLTRSNAIAWARKIVGDPNVVYLDTETTGLGRFARICDIAVIAQDGTTLLNLLVNPEISIPKAASDVHGITDDMVTSAPTWIEAMEGVRDHISGKTVVIYNRSYDEPILEQHNADLGLAHFEADFRCAMLAYSEYDGTLGNYGSLKWHKLDAAAAHFGIDPGGHRARADAETTRRVVHAMALEGGPLNAGTFVQVAPDETSAPTPPRYDINAAFTELSNLNRKRDEIEGRIGEIRTDINDHMERLGMESLEDAHTGYIARIDKIRSGKVVNADDLLRWAKSDPLGWKYHLETVDTKALAADIKKRGFNAPGFELVDSQRFVVTPPKGAS